MKFTKKLPKKSGIYLVENLDETDERLFLVSVFKRHGCTWVYDYPHSRGSVGIEEFLKNCKWSFVSK
jgi:hypothetical protein